MNKKLTILFLLHTFLFFLSQTKPPESYSLIRGVNENINMNSGTIELSIPLFEISEGQFKLSNNLNYESRGFVPHISPGYVGLNWNMMQFGKITRQSRKIDLTLLNTLRYPGLFGYAILWDHVSMQYKLNDCMMSKYQPINGQPPFKKNILNNPANSDYKPSSPYDTNSSYLNYYKDYDSDKFYFDFLGYKGYFVIDNEGQIIVYSENASLKAYVESKCYNIFGNIVPSQIIMVDDKGNKYFFGGTENELDINFSQAYLEYKNNDFVGWGEEKKRTNYIDSWLLKKIILNDGSIINGYYKPSNITLLNNYRGDGNFTKNLEPSTDVATNFPSKTVLDANNLTVKHTRVYEKTVDFFGGGTTIRTEYNSQLDTYTKEAILDSITVNDLTIHYSYNNTQNQLELTNKYLNEIKIKRKNKIIKKINLVYEDLGTSNKRTFLKNVTNTAGENLYFEYYKTDKFPPYNELLTNNLGFWNGVMDYNANNYQAWNYTPLPEDFSVYNVGMLKKITYPTKGTTTFSYENGDFSKEYNIDENTRIPNLFSKNGTVNAPRINKKIEYDLSGNNVETIYKYKNEDNSSSGIIDGKVTFRESIKGTGGAGTWSVKNMSPNLQTQNSLHYSNVMKFITNKGYAKYKFTDRVTNPDSLASHVYPDFYFQDWQDWDIQNNIYLSKEYERGKILKEEIYDNNNLKLKEISYKYGNF